VGASSQQLLGLFPPFLADGVTIPAGTSAELEGPWRKIALPAGPITLESGGYALGGLDNANSTDAIRYFLLFHSTSVPKDPRLTIGGPGYSQQTGFSRPDLIFLVDGVELGPMLFVVPVPEPSAAVLVGLALITFCGRRAQR
jgi:hypothetical protein